MSLDTLLDGKYLVVTGGSSGIGKEIVEQASYAGAKVLFTYNTGDNRALEIAGRTGSDSLKLTLGDQDSTRMFLTIISKQIDYFIANAGMELSGDLRKHTYDKINSVISANLTGNLYLLQELIIGQHMAQNGQIAVIGSIAADGNHDQLAYSSSKAGLRAAIETLSRYDSSVKRQNLGIKLIEPAFVRTGMTERFLPVIERLVRKKGGDQLLQEFRDRFVMEPKDAASRILNLTTDQNVVGVRQIPEFANLHRIRETYF